MSRFLLACTLCGVWRVVCKGYPEIWRESQALMWHFMLSMLFESEHTVCSLSGIFFLLYFSLNVNYNSVCANVVRKKNVLKGRVILCFMDNVFGPVSIAGLIQL